MEVSMISQFYVMLFSLILGIFLELIYELFSGLGILFGIFDEATNAVKKISEKFNYILNVKKKTITKFLLDFIYFVIITPPVLIFLHNVNDGIFRWYILVGTLTGFALCRLSLSRLLKILVQAVFILARIILVKVFAKINKVIVKAKKRVSLRKRVKKPMKKDLKKLISYGKN